MKKYNIAALKVQDVRELIRYGDNRQATQIRVTESGEVYLSTIVGFDELENIRFRMGIFAEDSGNVGPEAAGDDNYIYETYAKLLKFWEMKVRGCVDCII